MHAREERCATALAGRRWKLVVLSPDERSRGRPLGQGACRVGGRLHLRFHSGNHYASLLVLLAAWANASHTVWCTQVCAGVGAVSWSGLQLYWSWCLGACLQLGGRVCSLTARLLVVDFVVVHAYYMDNRAHLQALITAWNWVGPRLVKSYLVERPLCGGHGSTSPRPGSPHGCPCSRVGSPNVLRPRADPSAHAHPHQRHTPRTASLNSSPSRFSSGVQVIRCENSIRLATQQMNPFFLGRLRGETALHTCR